MQSLSERFAIKRKVSRGNARFCEWMQCFSRERKSIWQIIFPSSHIFTFTSYFRGSVETQVISLMMYEKRDTVASRFAATSIFISLQTILRQFPRKRWFCLNGNIANDLLIKAVTHSWMNLLKVWFNDSLIKDSHLIVAIYWCNNVACSMVHHS